MTILCHLPSRDCFSVIGATAWQASNERRSNSLLVEYVAQFVFGAFENALTFFRKIFAGAIDVEVQHRHGRLIRFRLATFAAFGRTLKRERDFSRTRRSKNFWLEIERVASLCHSR